jgi:hypothetical protein
VYTIENVANLAKQNYSIFTSLSRRLATVFSGVLASAIQSQWWTCSFSSFFCCCFCYCCSNDTLVRFCVNVELYDYGRHHIYIGVMIYTNEYNNYRPHGWCDGERSPLECGRSWVLAPIRCKPKDYDIDMCCFSVKSPMSIK